MLDRRTLLAGALAMPATGLARPARPPTSWGQEFAVSRDGAPIGQHRLRFSQDGPRTTAEIDIELQVKLAFITVYRYRHVNRELWEGGRLLSFASRTDDNGTAAPRPGAPLRRPDPGRGRPGPGRGAGRRPAHDLLAPPLPRRAASGSTPRAAGC